MLIGTWLKHPCKGVEQAQVDVRASGSNLLGTYCRRQRYSLGEKGGAYAGEHSAAAAIPLVVCKKRKQTVRDGLVRARLKYGLIPSSFRSTVAPASGRTTLILK